jgi:CRISPR/Cas system-associated endonuclease Cas1
MNPLVLDGIHSSLSVYSRYLRVKIDGVTTDYSPIRFDYDSVIVTSPAHSVTRQAIVWLSGVGHVPIFFLKWDGDITATVMPENSESHGQQI